MKKIGLLIIIATIVISCINNEHEKDFNIEYSRIGNTSEVNVKWEKQKVDNYEIYLVEEKSISFIKKCENNSTKISVTPGKQKELMILGKKGNRTIKSIPKNIFIENISTAFKKNDIISNGGKTISVDLELEKTDGNVEKVEIDWGDSHKSIIKNKLENIFTSHSYLNSGEYNIIINAYDSYNEVISVAKKVIVKDKEPIIDFNIKNVNSLKIIAYGEIIDLDGEITNVEINWGDEFTQNIILDESGKFYEEYQYFEDGTYFLELSATNSFGVEKKTEKKLTIINDSPIIELNLEKKRAAVNISGEVYNNSGNINSVEIHWGDGNVEYINTAFLNIDIDHRYSKEGTYEIIVYAYDKYMKESRKKYSVNIDRFKPELHIKTKRLDLVTLEISGIVISDFSEIKYLYIDWGDGNRDIFEDSFKDILIKHSYSKQDFYTIKIIGKDQNKRVVNKKIEIDLNYNLPELHVTLESEKMIGILTGNANSSENSIKKIEVDWGDGNSTQLYSDFENFNIRNHYKKIGNYLITIKAIDELGLIKEKSFNIETSKSTPEITFTAKNLGDNNLVVLKGIAGDKDSSIKKVEINWGDGESNIITDNFKDFIIKHRYEHSNIYKIKAVVYDEYDIISKHSQQLEVITYLPLEYIKINKNYLKVDKSEKKVHLDARVHPKGAYPDIIWESTNSDIIEVIDSSLVINKPGRTKIVAKSLADEKINDTCIVDVVIYPVDFFKNFVSVEKGAINDIEIDNSFYMQKNEVTIEEYLKFLNNYNIKPDGRYKEVKLLETNTKNSPITYEKNRFKFKITKYSHTLDSPIVGVTWYGAAAYCNWLSQNDGYDPVYDEYTWEPFLDNNVENILGYRLPTNIEWEYSAKGGVKSETSVYAGDNNLENVGWYIHNSNRMTHSVGLKQPNELGIYDMSGNVWEWTNSSKQSLIYIRGGSWYNYSSYCAVGFENYNFKNRSGNDLGFRVCRNK